MAALVNRLEAPGQEWALLAHVHQVGRVAGERLYPAARVVEAGQRAYPAFSFVAASPVSSTSLLGPACLKSFDSAPSGNR